MASNVEFAGHPFGYQSPTFRGYVVRVIDGDTYWIRLDLGFHAAMTVPVRLRRVDTPEVTTADGRLVRDEVRAMLEGRAVIVVTDRDRQSFARWIADVGILEEGQWMDLGVWLVDRGWGRFV